MSSAMPASSSPRLLFDWRGRTVCADSDAKKILTVWRALNERYGVRHSSHIPAPGDRKPEGSNPSHRFLSEGATSNADQLRPRVSAENHATRLTISLGGSVQTPFWISRNREMRILAQL